MARCRPSRTPTSLTNFSFERAQEEKEQHSSSAYARIGRSCSTLIAQPHHPNIYSSGASFCSLVHNRQKLSMGQWNMTQTPSVCRYLNWVLKYSLVEARHPSVYYFVVSRKSQSLQRPVGILSRHPNVVNGTVKTVVSKKDELSFRER